jgi:hypothetical protein
MDMLCIVRRVFWGGISYQGGKQCVYFDQINTITAAELGWTPVGGAVATTREPSQIDGYVELRVELEKLGHTFHAQSDTEILLKACMQWGAQALPRLMGMFAFAVLDQRRESLFLDGAIADSTIQSGYLWN